MTVNGIIILYEYFHRRDVIRRGTNYQRAQFEPVRVPRVCRAFLARRLEEHTQYRLQRQDSRIARDLARHGSDRATSPEAGAAQSSASPSPTHGVERQRERDERALREAEPERLIIVGVSGLAGAGKTTVGNYLANFHRFEHVDGDDAELVPRLLLERGEPHDWLDDCNSQQSIYP